MSHPTRRRLLQSAVLSPLGLMGQAAAAEAAPFTFVHLTDPHVQPELGGGEGLRQCLAKINALNPRPDFVITGGDLIMDALHVEESRAALEWKLFGECLGTLELPVHHVIGNHDVGGWSSRARMPQASRYFAKEFFMEHYGQGHTYRSFDHKGWHFILLDSIGQIPGSPDYRGWVDDTQLAWLEADLRATGPTTPIVIVTHIPLQSAMHQLAANPSAAPLPPNALVNNFSEFRPLLRKHNVKLVLSGHGHVRERIELSGMTHIQSGAVSGLWWKGPVAGEAEAFGIVECSADSFAYRYQDYGWKARPA